MIPGSRHDGFGVIDDDLRAVLGALGHKAAAFSGKSVLITGAAGFLPAYLAEALAALNDSGVLDRPCRMVLLVRDKAGFDGRLRRLRERADTKLIAADLSRPYEVAERADFVIHAASPASPSAYMRDPVGCLDVNVLGLRALLDSARTWESQSVLYFSSSEIYGSPEPAAIPTPETYVGRVDPLGPRACYAEAKRAGESYCRAYFERYGVPVKIVRIFHTYGPGLRHDDGRILATLVAAGCRGERLSIMGDGRATRAHGYVSDVTADFLNVLLSDYDGEVFNVGGDAEISILDLATLVSEIFGRHDDVLVSQAPAAASLAGAADRVCPDLSKIREAFGHPPRVGLREGIERYARWQWAGTVPGLVIGDERGPGEYGRFSR